PGPAARERPGPGGNAPDGGRTCSEHSTGARQFALPPSIRPGFSGHQRHAGSTGGQHGFVGAIFAHSGGGGGSAKNGGGKPLKKRRLRRSTQALLCRKRPPDSCSAF